MAVVGFPAFHLESSSLATETHDDHAARWQNCLSELAGSFSCFRESGSLTQRKNVFISSEEVLAPLRKVSRSVVSAERTPPHAATPAVHAPHDTSIIIAAHAQGDHPSPRALPAVLLEPQSLIAPPVLTADVTDIARDATHPQGIPP